MADKDKCSYFMYSNQFSFQNISKNILNNLKTDIFRAKFRQCWHFLVTYLSVLIWLILQTMLTGFVRISCDMALNNSEKPPMWFYLTFSLSIVNCSRFNLVVLYRELIGYTKKEESNSFWRIYLMIIQFDADSALYKEMWNIKQSKVKIIEADFWCQH